MPVMQAPPVSAGDQNIHRLTHGDLNAIGRITTGIGAFVGIAGSAISVSRIFFQQVEDNKLAGQIGLGLAFGGLTMVTIGGSLLFSRLRNILTGQPENVVSAGQPENVVLAVQPAAERLSPQQIVSGYVPAAEGEHQQPQMYPDNNLIRADHVIEMPAWPPTLEADPGFNQTVLVPTPNGLSVRQLTEGGLMDTQATSAMFSTRYSLEVPPPGITVTNSSHIESAPDRSGNTPVVRSIG